MRPSPSSRAISGSRGHDLRRDWCVLSGDNTSSTICYMLELFIVFNLPVALNVAGLIALTCLAFSCPSVKIGVNRRSAGDLSRIFIFPELQLSPQPSWPLLLVCSSVFSFCFKLVLIFTIVAFFTGPRRLSSFCVDGVQSAYA